MSFRKRYIWGSGLATVAMVTIALGVALTSGTVASGGPGVQIDDGAELLDQTSISLDAAISAAQAAFKGDLGEIDIEDFNGTLVFNIDVGDKDVKVDAGSGEVLGSVSDDEGDNDD